jgi:hypothetical protein
MDHLCEPDEMPATGALPDAGASPLPDTSPDRRLLRFMAQHRFAGFEQVRSLLGCSPEAARAAVRRLEASGRLRSERPYGGRASFFLITASGLRAVDSRLRPPALALSAVEHDLGLGWLWLAAHGGAFGSVESVIPERVMRSRDATAGPGGQPFGVRLGGLGPGGRERLHYPDLLLVTPEGRRVALELELSDKGRARREKILGGYAADVRIDAVLYLAGNPRLARSIQRSAASMGIDHLVRVQMASVTDPLAARSAGHAGPARAGRRAARELGR